MVKNVIFYKDRIILLHKMKSELNKNHLLDSYEQNLKSFMSKILWYI